MVRAIPDSQLLTRPEALSSFVTNAELAAFEATVAATYATIVDVAADIAALSAVYQPLNATLTSISGLSITGSGDLVRATSPVLVTPTLTSPVITGGSINNTPIGGTTPAAGAFTTLLTSGAVTFNDAGADVDFRVEGDTDANLLFVDASADSVTIGAALPSNGGKFNVSPAVSGKGVVIRANATTPGNMQEWQSGTSGTALASMSGRGLLTLGAGGQYTNAAEQLGATITGYFTNDTYPPLRLNNQNSAQPASALGIFGSNGSERTIDLNWNGTSKFNLVNSGTLSGVLTMKTLVRESIGGTTPAAGFGAAIALNLHSSTTINQSAARIRWLWTTATHASRVSNLILSVYNVAAETDVLTLAPSGAYINATATNAWAFSSYGVMQIGDGLGLWSQKAGSDSYVSQNTYFDGSSYRAIRSAAAIKINLGSSGQFRVQTAPSVAAAAAQTFTDIFTISNTGLFTIFEGGNLALGTTTGTKIGTATSQKLALWNATPDVQPTNVITAAAFVANTSGILNDSATWGGYTGGQVVAALKRLGALA